MNILRKILFPLAIVYWLVTFLRNKAYDIGFFKSTSFNKPLIAIGNLSSGGTGKTPFVEYLLSHLSTKKVVVLSRGYKRKTKGLVWATKYSTALDIGDEPFQIHSKFPNTPLVVHANRVEGVSEIIAKLPNTEVVVLDDAYQHRKLKASFYVLLTSFDALFSSDYILPFGNLREPKNGKKRANVVFVTKCPATLSVDAQQKISAALQVKVPVYFTNIAYDTLVHNANERLSFLEFTSNSFIAVAGIAKPKPFFDYLKISKTSTLVYPDHHNFTDNDISKILQKAKGNKIITTEKDFTRLEGKIPADQLYYLPIKMQFLANEVQFQNQIHEHLG